MVIVFKDRVSRAPVCGGEALLVPQRGDHVHLPKLPKDVDKEWANCTRWKVESVEWQFQTRVPGNSLVVPEVVVWVSPAL
jgi:hypothetical protein